MQELPFESEDKQMKKIRRCAASVIALTLVLGLFTLTALAADKLDQNMSGADMTFGERFEYAIQGTVTGMLMVFAVLGLLFGIVTLSRVFLYDIPNSKKARLTPMKTAQQRTSDWMSWTMCVIKKMILLDMKDMLRQRRALFTTV